MKFDYLIVLEPKESKGISGKGMYKDFVKTFQNLTNRVMTRNQLLNWVCCLR